MKAPIFFSSYVALICDKRLLPLHSLPSRLARGIIYSPLYFDDTPLYFRSV